MLSYLFTRILPKISENTIFPIIFLEDLLLTYKGVHIDDVPIQNHQQTEETVFSVCFDNKNRKIS